MPDRCPPAALQPAAAGLDHPDPVTMLSRLCRTAEREISLMVRAATYVRLRPQITELSRERDLVVRAVVHHRSSADDHDPADHHHDRDDHDPRDHHPLDQQPRDHVGGSGCHGSPSRMITTARALDRELVLIDRRRAVVVEQLQADVSPSSRRLGQPGQPGQPGPRGLVVTEPLAVRALHDLVLSSAGLDRPLASERDQCPLGVPDVTADDVEVLHCLAAGTPDERAADQLGLSVRTYRRRLARLMQTLRVQTRFQAALQARDSRLI